MVKLKNFYENLIFIYNFDINLKILQIYLYIFLFFGLNFLKKIFNLSFYNKNYA